MTNYEVQRTKMVDNQVRTTDVTSYSVLSAFLTVPREAFVPEAARALAYVDADSALSVPGRYIMHASPLAKLLQLATISQTDHVLDVGAGSGYVSALLAHLAGSVVALESDAGLAALARANLSGHANAKVVEGDLEKGAAGEGPFDVIFIDGAVDLVPEALFAQLKDGGKLVAVLGHGNASRAHVFTRERGALSSTPAFNTAVKPLPGFRKVPEFQF
nr:protein-L-isoaspartate O-methyltransferase [uncultured Gellertiella sp.]